MSDSKKQKLSEESAQNNQPFESDAQKLAHEHLADPNHVITEEALRNIRIGMTPPPDAPTEEAIQEVDDKVADHKSDKEDETIPGGQKATPWDVIE